MRGKLTAATGTILLIVLGIIGFGPASAPAQQSTGAASVSVLAQRGFGDYRNSYSWGMAWFKGKLYVGTGRQVACVEAATQEFYLPNLHAYNTNPAVNTKCPADKYDMKLRAEIWQYTPGSDTWKRVYRSPAVENPRSPGSTIARDIAYRGMGVIRDARGRKMLVVAGVSANEYIPELGAKYMPRLLHTTDGRHFGASSPSTKYTVTTLTGTRKPMGFRSIEQIGGRVYATASTGLTGDGAIVQVKGLATRRPVFKQVSPTNLAVFEIEQFHGHLYAGVGDDKNGYSVYRALDRAPRSDRWTVLVNNGAGRGVKLTSVVSMHVFRDRLYVGSSGWLNQERTQPATEVIRIAPDNSWEVVVGSSRLDHGVVKFPVSGLGDGWGSGFVAHPWRMESQDGALYVGTNDYSTSLITTPGTILQSGLSPEYGFDVWATCDGTYWFPVTRNAFGGNAYDFGARTMQATPQGLAVGSANHAQGTTVFRKDVGACSSGIRKGKATASASSAAGPRSLLADAQQGGTVVSWSPAAAGTTYRVMRAAMPKVRVSVKAPALLGNGFAAEDAAPQVVAAGTPGSQTLDVTGYGAFRAIGTTRKAVFVDRSRRAGAKYAYKVIAVRDGLTVGSTGVQVVPSDSPAPSYGQVVRQIGEQTGWKVAMTSSTGKPSKAAIARLGRAAGGDAALQDVVDRLARRVRYADLAGGSAAKG